MKLLASPNPRPVLAMAGALGLFGCSSLERFETRGDAAYCGNLVTAPRFHGGLLPRSAIPPTLSLRLELEPEKLTSRPADTSLGPDNTEPYAIVGHLTSDDSERGLCRDFGRSLFEESPLRTIPEVDHDALKLLEFGEGRDYNFLSWVDSTCQGTLLAVVSLMRNDSVEVRLLKPAPLAPPDVGAQAERPGFGLFYLHREEDGCAF